jgi:hypothetical protein
VLCCVVLGWVMLCCEGTTSRLKIAKRDKRERRWIFFRS